MCQLLVFVNKLLSTILYVYIDVLTFTDCYCTVYVYVVIHCCDRVWYFLIEANLLSFFGFISVLVLEVQI